MDRVHGLFALGTTGEATGVSPKVRREMVERTCGLVRGRVPVWVGVTDTCVEESVEMGRFAEKAGAAGVVAAAPYYLPVEQGELMRYVKAIVERQGLPVVLYNIPALTKMGYEVETVRRLAEMGRVVGIKDSSGDIGYLRDLMAGVKREGCYQGGEVCAGGDGNMWAEDGGAVAGVWGGGEGDGEGGDWKVQIEN
ncbi:MAG: dihydrodipicolinate synthase family protein [Planctomycetota bacterium]|nr:dihydrodipicolinate synthase family protein [Planctomycetota bacterium]